MVFLRRAAPLLLIPLAACGDARSAPGGAWVAAVDTVADTVVVRTLSGSAWGDTMVLVPELEIGVLEGPKELIFGQIRSLDVDGKGRIWVMDGQGPELRVFGPDGTFLRRVGRQGQGPGELSQPDGGLRVLSDGRVLVRDPFNNRIQVFSAEGEPLATWPLRGNFSTSNPLWRDRHDNVYTQVLRDSEAGLDEWRMALVRFAPDGNPGDSLPIPDSPFEDRYVEARSESSWSRSSVPFAPSESWLLHPDGYFVHGTSSTYAFTHLRDGEALPLRVEREDWRPVPVAAGEADEARRRITVNMRRMVPEWSWNGEGIPDHKPAFRSLYAAVDGRVWVLVHAPGYRVEDPDHDPSDPSSVPREWREDLVFEVFEADGRFLGPVRAPPDLSPYPTPRFEGDRVWAVAQDELGVQRVVRYRVEAVGGGAGEGSEGGAER